MTVLGIAIIFFTVKLYLTHAPQMPHSKKIIRFYLRVVLYLTQNLERKNGEIKKKLLVFEVYVQAIKMLKLLSKIILG